MASKIVAGARRKKIVERIVGMQWRVFLRGLQDETRGSYSPRYTAKLPFLMMAPVG